MYQAELIGIAAKNGIFLVAGPLRKYRFCGFPPPGKYEKNKQKPFSSFIIVNKEFINNKL